ncbi:MAG TPA: ABC transporter substrate-binding protein [Bradyrhizobium sp.]|nr:ABC transporter substrate-binding protein [Bradyrhizobium sp.]
MKHLRTLFLVGAVAISSPAFAQQTMYVAGYGGSFQKEMEANIIPEFEAKHNVRIVYVPGISSETVAKLQAQKGHEQINVAIIDDGPMYQAIQYGDCDSLENAPVYNDIYDFAHLEGHAIGIGLNATGIVYNTEDFKKNGWAPPTSWQDLTDKKYSQRFTTSSISGTYGVDALVVFARINGGGEKNIKPGFDAIREKLAPNVVSWSSSPAQIAEMFENGDIDIAVWGSNRAIPLKDSGFPVEFVYPKEGAVALVAAACVVVQNGAPELSQAFVQYLVSPEVQVKLATQGFGPANRKTSLDRKLAAALPYGTEKMAKMMSVDWPTINQHRAEWTNEWNRTIEK